MGLSYNWLTCSVAREWGRGRITVPSNKELKLTKPGTLRSFAA
jgi:hypothetical protein